MNSTKRTSRIMVQDVSVTILNIDRKGYISLTDMAEGAHRCDPHDTEYA